MSDSMHTPGPWTVALARKEHVHQTDHHIVADGRYIAHVDNRAFHYGEGLSVTEQGLAEGVANAHLMGAAAEMLAALKIAAVHVSQYLEYGGPCRHELNVCFCDLRSDLQKVVAAIAKAEGRQ